MLPPRQRAERKKESAEVDEYGDEYLAKEEWQPMASSSQPKNFAKRTVVDVVFEKLYGDLPSHERFRVLWLSGTLFFIIGGYWLLRSLKDPIVSTIVGVEYIPKCKMVSLVIVFFLVFVYNKLIDMFPKHQLFYIIGGFYTVLFCLIALLLGHPTIGLENTDANPQRLLGWISYSAIESFGSICVSLFWSFVNSTMNFDGAKSAYGLIIAGAQIGSILGPSIAAAYATTVGVAALYGIGALVMGFMVLMIYFYVKIFGVPQTLKLQEKEKKKEKSAGVLEGFYLFMKYSYVRGIFALSCLFMVEVTILDFAMKVLATQEFHAQYPDDRTLASQHFAAFMGVFGQITNGISFLFSLFGTSFVVRRLGLRMTLLAFPSLCVCVIVFVMMVPKLSSLFFALILLKAFSYSLNNPCKEMLYQPTSTSVKFKSKSWIDIFGGRGSKALGSIVTNAFSDNTANLFHFGGSIAAAVGVFLIWVANFMGKKFDEYQDMEYMVGEEKREFEALNDESEDENSIESGGQQSAQSKSEHGVEMTKMSESSTKEI